MKKLLTAIVLSGVVSLGIGMHPSYASEIDALLQKLINKGILTASEAQEIRTETNDEIAKTEKQKLEDYKAVSKDILPDWVKNTTLKGDFRLRYAYNHINDSTNDNQRGRIRLRTGVAARVAASLPARSWMALRSLPDVGSV